MKKYDIYITAIALILFACTTIISSMYLKSRKENERHLTNQAILIQHKDSIIIMLSKKEMLDRIKYEQKDSAFKQACKERDINKKRVTEFIKASMTYKDSITTVLVEVPVYVHGQKQLVKMSNYSDGWNTVENMLIGDSLINVFSGKDSLYIVNHYGWYGWKILPRFLREKWSRTEFINKNPKMDYKINFTSKLDK